MKAAWVAKVGIFFCDLIFKIRKLLNQPAIAQESRATSNLKKALLILYSLELA